MLSSSPERTLVGDLARCVNPLLPYLRSYDQVNINADGAVWVATRTDAFERVEIELEARRRELLARYTASYFRRSLTEERPFLSDAPLPLEGRHWRVTIARPPITKRGVAISLRHLSEHPIPLPDWVKEGRVERAVAEDLVERLARRVPVLVIGENRSGKTSFANALLAEVIDRHPGLRTTVIEDTPEIKVSENANCEFLTTSPGVDLDALVPLALRMDSHLLVVGEIRDRRVVSLFDALLTGHGGLTTFHAASAEEAHGRIALLAGRAPNDASIAALFRVVVKLQNAHVVRVSFFDESGRPVAHKTFDREV